MIFWDIRFLFFYDYLFPKSYIVHEKDIDKIEDFATVTPEFLSWYLARFEIAEVRVDETIACVKADDPTQKRFGDERYIVCQVTYRKKRMNSQNHAI